MSEQVTSLVQASDLNRLFDLDAQVCDANLPAVIEHTVSLWRAVHGNNQLAEILEWGLIYSLRTTIIMDGPHAGCAKWQVTQLRNYPFAKTWEEFCLNHLDMSPSEASNKKRNWEIYVIQLGYNLIDLMIAGVQRLNVARATLVKCLSDDPPVFPENLVRAVFGEPHICAACEEYIPFLDHMPEKCPECGEDYRPANEPKTVAQVKAIVAALKGTPVDRPHAVADFEQTDERIVLLPYWVDEQGDKYALPPWEIPILGAGVYADVGGIPADLVDAFRRWIRGRFGRVEAD